MVDNITREKGQIENMPDLFIGFRTYAVALLLILGSLLVGCSTGPLDPARLSQVRSRDEYIALARQYVAHDEIFFLNKAGEAMWLDALSLSPALLAAGQARWASDKRYLETISQWLPEGTEAAVTLVGLYVRGLVKDDVLKNGRFRFQLLAGGQLLEPLEVQEVKPEIWADYFPVFSRWEKVFAVRFPVAPGSDGVLTVNWPSGHREVVLVSPRTVQARSEGSGR
jgi:hypothetical protein